ncbi:Monoterpene epsilon-lactone hydrolase [Brevundimonas sp. SH203]|uniref:alpha/beta hydrolase fold domain-containing protein n=1 Tax=Brevundimonas sp. SH203 TaxID=345167 RepID=UPI0009C5B01B|nr:alpha/beta hydrolase fold domain-containing protein [Brevundimonas sp. SH203]GAW41119.1 Monoterpene epsilon-lactone hydrolase [Brevundimonas sp. SH203]
MKTTKGRAWTRLAGLVLAGLSLAGTAVAQTTPATTPPQVLVDAEGTVQVPAMTVPVSSLLSPQARAYVAEHLVQMQKPELLAQKDGVPIFMQPYLDRQNAQFAYDRADTRIGGVHVYDYRPKAGVAAENARRVLINLHGGGFMGCWPGCAELESIPLTDLGRIRVVAVDYRQGPEHRFPAASEDVAAVYRELLKTYPAQNIGIYGCSAGGMLTGMSVAWFQSHDLPRPGAVGVFCAGATLSAAGFGGDSDYFNGPLGDSRLPPPYPNPAQGDAARLPYLVGADLSDPLVSPTSSDAVLGRFPPTLIITGTRGFELSSSVYTHTQLVRLGVDAELHVWEGLFHGFFYNADVPESRQAYDVMLRFFDRKLGR